MNCAIVARPVWIVLIALCVAGCQSNADRDLIARDRRMQEDQMWAMQDYIQQYQQLVCQFRSENAALRRQLNDDRNGPMVERAPQPEQRMPMGPPATKGSPKFQNPPAPGMEQKQTPSPNNDMPDVPPLGQGTSINSNHYAQLASYETPVDRGTALATDAAPIPRTLSNGSPSDTATCDPSAAATSPDILLSGEVVANDSGGGPRLVIDIEPFDQSGRVAHFDGNVSLALLTSEGGVQHRIARWDFGPDDVRATVNKTAGEATMRFLVELPAGTKADGSTELWAKLAPTDGARQFSHAKLDLTKPGVFSSRTEKTAGPSEEKVVAASYVEESSQPEETTVAINESEWSTAKPGKPAILPPASNDTTGGWKATSEPLPAVVENTKTPPLRRNDRPKPIEPAPAKTAPVEVAPKPSWTPERPGKPTSAARPTWSATR